MFENVLRPGFSREGVSARKERILAELEAKNQNYEKKLEELESEGISRRGFLKFMGAAIALGIGGKMLMPGEKAAELVKEVEQTGETKENYDDEIFYDGQEPDIEAIKNIFNFNMKEPIKITLETADKLKDYWKHKYATKMKDDLIGALDGMKPMLPELRSIFKKYDVPEEYALLAIPESHWKFGEISPAGAEGPYQFMPKTGKKFGLMNSGDRRDPLKSAKACAELLKDLFNRTGDWDLALSGYNGGFIWEYLGQCKKRNREPNYQDFLEKFLTEKANHIKREVHEQLFANHIVAKGDTLTNLSKKYNLGTKAIKSANRLKSNQLRIGQVLKFPLSNAKKSNLFEKKIRGIAENLNYPPKFLAVFELVENTLAWKKGEGEQPKV